MRSAIKTRRVKYIQLEPLCAALLIVNSLENIDGSGLMVV
jgi:hypothetical protein